MGHPHVPCHALVGDKDSGFFDGEKPFSVWGIQVHDPATVASGVGQIAGVGRGILDFLMVDFECGMRDDFGILLE